MTELAEVDHTSTLPPPPEAQHRAPQLKAPAARATQHCVPSASGAPPVILLGGEANALSVARELGRQGVKVFILCSADACVRSSRFCTWIDMPTDGKGGDEHSWARYLLSSDSDHLRGALVLACSDAGIQVLVRHRAALVGRFLLDDADPQAQLAMLDKLFTYQHAAAAGVATPQFWAVASRQEIESLRGELVYPLMLKPRLSHLFEGRFGRKHVVVFSFDELLTAYNLASDAHLDVLLVEHIPGGDEKLCSYYTYLDEPGEPLFHFTKRVIRRYPSGMGSACYHVTDWIPELIEPSLRLLRHAGVRGLANIEFKTDPRDGRHKLIECNARFTASDALVAASGCRIASFIYHRITGHGILPPMSEFRWGLRLWDPVRDFLAFGERRRAGELTLRQWLAGILHRQSFPFFQWTDPLPTLMRLSKPLRRRMPSVPWKG